jgi:hypothetical protein
VSCPFWEDNESIKDSLRLYGEPRRHTHTGRLALLIFAVLVEAPLEGAKAHGIVAWVIVQ